MSKEKNLLTGDGRSIDEEETKDDERSRSDVPKNKKIHRGLRKSGKTVEEVNKKWEENVKQWKTVLNKMDEIKKAKKLKEEKTEEKRKQAKVEHHQWFGDELLISKDWPKKSKEGTIRLYSQNVNGISYFNNYGEWEIMLEELHDRQVDVACLTEINLDLQKPEIKYSLVEKAKALDKGIRMEMTASKTRIDNSPAKRGGVMVFARGNWSGRVVRSGSDTLGRWSYLTMQGKREKKTTIITLYRVCEQKNQAGNCTIYMQQENDLKNAGRDVVNPRNAILIDLAKIIAKEHQDGNDIILMGDCNEDVYSKKQIHQFLQENELYNAIAAKHCGEGPATYDRGSKCIDLIAISKTINRDAIVRCGYLPFYDGVFSDHRGSYIDLKASELFEKADPDTNKEIYKRFTTKQTKKCEKYIKKLEEYLDEAKINVKVSELQQKIKEYINNNKGSRIELVQQSQTLFNKTTQLMVASEKRAGKKPYKNGFPFSSEVRNAGHDLVASRKEIRKEKLKEIVSIDRLVTLEDNRDECKKELKKKQSEAKIHRENELERLAEKRAGEWNLTASQAIIVIKNAEEAKSTHRFQRNFLRPRDGCGISKIYVPAPRSNHVPEETDITNEKIQYPVENPKEVFNTLLLQNFRSLLKSDQSIFSSGILTERMGNELEKSFTEEILNGFDPDEKIKSEYKEYGQTIVRFIKALQYACAEDGTRIEQYDWKFGIEEYKSVFSKTNETKACGPSGLHMSHWKAALESEKIMEVHAFFIWSAFSLGHSYERWEKTWHCMLQKKKFPFSQKLRIIQLFEGDFNAGLKYLIGKRLMWHLLDKKMIDDEVFGSCKGRTGCEALITLQLLGDHSRVWKKNLVVLFNDAAGCFDRVPPTLAEIALRRLGVPKSIASSHTKTQRSMKHYVKTVVGVSKGFIKFGLKEKKIMLNGIIMTLIGLIGGIGQGGGASPIIWLSVLLIMMTVYKQTQMGASIVDCVNSEELKMHIISYVDDNSIVRHFNKNTSAAQMMEAIKTNLSEWQKLLQLTGGDLSLDKCKITVLKWVQTGVWGRVNIEKIKPQEEKLAVCSIKNKQKQEFLERLEPTHAERVLGVRLPLSGSMTTEFHFRKKQLKEFSTRLYKSPLQQKDAYSAFQTRYKSIASYPYPVTTFSTKEVHEIQKEAIRNILPKLGVNRNMPRVVLFGPVQYGGRQLTDLRIEQPVLNLKATIGHMRRRDKMAKMLLATMRDLQIECGREVPFFQLDPNEHEYVTDSTRWLYTWKMAKEFNIQIKVAQHWIPTPKFVNDGNIMKKAIEDPHYQGKNKYKLVTINQCRLYQKAFFISDLLRENSSSIVDKRYLYGDEQHQHEVITVPYDMKPTKFQWGEWRAFIYRNFLAGIYEIRPGLGMALQNHDNTVRMNDSGRILADLKKCSTLEETVNTLPPHMRDIIGTIKSNDDGLVVFKELQHGTALGATDGSLVTRNGKKYGAHSYVIGGQSNDDFIITGTARTPNSTTISSLTTELYGLIAYTLVMICITKHYESEDMITKNVTVYCDNEQAVKMAKSVDPPINVSETMEPEYDLKILLQDLLEICPIKICHEWIKAHQNEDKETKKKIFGPFQRNFQFNIIADELAHTEATTNGNQSIVRPVYSSTVLGAYNENGVFIGDLRKQLIASIHGKGLQAYLKKKHTWDNESLHKIHWEAIEAALSSYGPSYRTKICQLMHDWQYIGERKKLMYDKDNKCPMQCGEIETRMHYVRCKDVAISDKRKKAMRILQKQLQAMHTCPGIITCIMRILNYDFEDQWKDQIQDGSKIGELLHQAYTSQMTLGENSVPKGYLVQSWESAQDTWQRSTNTSNKLSHEQWMKKLIVAIHTYTYSLWKARNDVLHKDKVKSKTALKRSKLQARIASLYDRGRANLTHNELKYFKLPVEQRQKKGVENMMLWITMVETIFRKRGEARQMHIDSWLTNSTPPKDWKDKFKETGRRTKNLVDSGLGGRILDSG